MATADKAPFPTSITPQPVKIPGYSGFCPTVRTKYGATYGNATKHFYQIRRHDILNTSQKLFQRSRSEEGVSVINLSVVSQRPTSSNKRESNPWSTLIPYSLCLTGARRDKTFEFDKSVQAYRAYYKDHSGLTPPVSAIHHRRHSAPSFGRYQATDPFTTSKQQTSTSSHYVNSERRGSAKERATRDVFFQKR